MVSKSQDTMFQLQQNIRNNNTDIRNMVDDLRSWSSQMHVKETKEKGKSKPEVAK
jgi:hypothetical protein